MTSRLSQPALLVAIGTSSLLYLPAVPSAAAYVVILTMYIIALFIFLIEEDETLKFSRSAVLPLVVIWLVLIGNLLWNSLFATVHLEVVVHVVSFVLVTAVNVFIVPEVVKLEKFFGLLARFGAVIAALGMVVYITGEYTIGPLVVGLSPGGAFKFVPGLGPQLLPTVSIFTNQNTVSFVCMLGFSSACVEYYRTRSTASGLFVLVNALGLHLGHGRAAIAAALIASVLLGSYLTLGANRFRAFGVAGLGAALVGFLMIARVVPAPEVIVGINLTGRLSLWMGGMRAFLARPLFGYGSTAELGTLIRPFVNSEYKGYSMHNSYLRMFITAGAVGGFAYLYFVAHSLYYVTFSKLDSRTIVIAIVAIEIALTQMFADYSIFGVGLRSVLAAVIFGYASAPSGSKLPVASRNH